MRLLADRNFGPYFAAKLLSGIGGWVHNVTAAVYVFGLTRSATMVGAVSIAQFVPQIVLTPLAGAWADRGDRRRQLIFGRLLSASGAGTLAGLVGFGGDLADARMVIGLSLVVGIGFAFSAPAMHAIVPALVRREELPAAIALNTVPYTAGRAAGPAIGALLLATAGPAAGFGAAAVANVLFAGVMLFLRVRPVQRRASFDAGVLGGVRHLRADPAVAILLAGVTAVGVGVDPVITLTPTVADALGQGEGFVGLLASAFGCGAMGGILVVGAVRRRIGLYRLVFVGLGLLGGGMAALGLSPSALAAVASLFIAGMGMMAAMSALTTQLQQRLPDDLRGRVMALWSLAFMGSRPAAAAMNGVIADATSARTALLVVTALLACVMAGLALSSASKPLRSARTAL